MGIVFFTFAVIALAVGLHAGVLLPVLGASLVAGMALGAAFTASMRGMLAGITPRERAGLLATVYLVSYAGAAVTGLIAGRLSRIVGLAEIATGYAALVVVACGVALVVTRRGHVK
ncbi:hypothetical protein R1X32_07015 (plasmid) [Rhodococcus opacus]|uniref:hypothetical protein n=1 Tax=Rhodococcus opacus TaxID=37919 RepID=UPI0034D169A7